MKISKMENNCIRVTLTRADLADFNLDFGKITPESPEMKGFIKKIIEAVSAETGIFIEEGQILIETGEDESLILVIKKVCQSMGLRRQSGLKGSCRSERFVFELVDCEELFFLLASVSEKLLPRMRIYRYNSRFYISMPRFPLPLVLWEFSEKYRKNRMADAILGEHGTLIAKGEQVIKMADAIKKSV